MEWWTRPIVIAPNTAPKEPPDKAPNMEFTRKNLVTVMADQEGAHVDATLDQEYFALSRQNAIGLEMAVGGKKVEWNEDPVPPAIRQVAHEVIETLDEQAASLLAASATE